MGSRWIRPAAACLFAMLSSTALAGDWYVITATTSTQEQAWTAAAELGGWTLDHDLYDGLKPEKWSVVHGPYSKPASAKKALRLLQRERGYEQAYIKEAGNLLLPAPIGTTGVPPIALVALLGELEVRAVARDAGEGPCAPDQPYWDISLSVRDVRGKVSEPQELDQLGVISVLRETGEVRHGVGCKPALVVEPEEATPAEQTEPSSAEDVEAPSESAEPAKE